MFNKQTVMQMASKFLGNDSLQKLSNAYDIANKITDMTSDPGEALRKAGVTIQDLQKARSFVNSPVASMLLMGKKDTLLSGLDRAESFLSNKISSPVEPAPMGELEQMQANLARLK